MTSEGIDELHEQIQACFEVYDTSVDWKIKIQSLIDLEESFKERRGMGLEGFQIEWLLPLAEFLNQSISCPRSEVVKKTCRAIQTIAQTCGPRFAPFSNTVLLDLLNTARVKIQVISNAGAQCMQVLSQYSRYSVEYLCRLFHESRTDEVRLLILNQVYMVLKAWPKEELNEHYDNLKILLQRGMSDKNGHVRSKSRETFCIFCDLWNEYMDELVDVPSPRHRSSFALEYSDAAITIQLEMKHGSRETTPIRTPLKMLRMTSAQHSKSTIPVHRQSSAPAILPRRLTFNDSDCDSDVSNLESPCKAKSEINSDLEELHCEASLERDGHRTRHYSAPREFDTTELPVAPCLPEAADDDLSTPLLSTPVPSTVDPSSHNPKNTRPRASTLRRVVDMAVACLTVLAVSFAAYLITGFICTRFALDGSRGVVEQVKQLDVSITSTYHDMKSNDDAMDLIRQHLLESMHVQREEFHQALQTLRKSSEDWNKSMRKDMESFKLDFIARLVPADVETN